MAGSDRGDAAIDHNYVHGATSPEALERATAHAAAAHPDGKVDDHVHMSREDFDERGRGIPPPLYPAVRATYSEESD